MTPEQIEAMLEDALSFNEYEMNGSWAHPRSRAKANAVGLEHVLYQCPALAIRCTV